jgi:hypothetical protein
VIADGILQNSSKSAGLVAIAGVLNLSFAIPGLGVSVETPLSGTASTDGELIDLTEIAETRTPLSNMGAGNATLNPAENACVLHQKLREVYKEFTGLNGG